MRTSGTRPPLFTSVLCPIDFSEHARLALQYAVAIARRGGSALHLLYVNDPLLVAAAAAAYNRDSLGAASRDELARFVEASVTTRLRKGLRVRQHISLGKPVRDILRTALTQQSDLIVVGTKGLNGARKLLLGSTTAALLRRARVPVLAVPPVDVLHDARVTPDGRWPGRRIVAAIEFGPHAATDVLRAREIARHFRASLVLAHVVPVPATPPWLSAHVDEHLREACSRAETAMAALRGELHDSRVRSVVRVGHPPDQIAAIAADYRAGLIVMGLRGHAGLFADHAGAYAYQVLCHGVAPVLALPDARHGTTR